MAVGGQLSARHLHRYSPSHSVLSRIQASCAVPACMKALATIAAWCAMAWRLSMLSFIVFMMSESALSCPYRNSSTSRAGSSPPMIECMRSTLPWAFSSSAAAGAGDAALEDRNMTGEMTRWGPQSSTDEYFLACGRRRCWRGGRQGVARVHSRRLRLLCLRLLRLGLCLGPARRGRGGGGGRQHRRGRRQQREQRVQERLQLIVVEIKRNLRNRGR